MQISLALVQLHLILGNAVEACSRLRSIESISHRPGVVSVVVHLYTHAGDIDAAMQVLDDAVAHAKENKASHITHIKNNIGILQWITSKGRR